MILMHHDRQAQARRVSMRPCTTLTASAPTGCEFNWSAQHMLGVGDATASACQIYTNRKSRCFLVPLTRACTTSDRRYARSQRGHRLQTLVYKDGRCCVDRLSPQSPRPDRNLASALQCSTAAFEFVVPHPHRVPPTSRVHPTGSHPQVASGPNFPEQVITEHRAGNNDRARCTRVGRNGKSPGRTTRALDVTNDVDTPGSMRADNADNPAIPTWQLPATRRRLYDNLPLPEERDPLSLLLATR